MDSLDTEIPQLCSQCELAMVCDMQIKDYFDRLISLLIVTTWPKILLWCQIKEFIVV